MIYFAPELDYDIYKHDYCIVKDSVIPETRQRKSQIKQSPRVQQRATGKRRGKRK